MIFDRSTLQQLQVSNTDNGAFQIYDMQYRYGQGRYMLLKKSINHYHQRKTSKFFEFCKKWQVAHTVWGHLKSFQNTFGANIYKYTSALQVLNDEYQDESRRFTKWCLKLSSRFPACDYRLDEASILWRFFLPCRTHIDLIIFYVIIHEVATYVSNWFKTCSPRQKKRKQHTYRLKPPLTNWWKDSKKNNLAPSIGSSQFKVCFPHLKLVGGFYPSEKYARQIGSFPQGLGWK